MTAKIKIHSDINKENCAIFGTMGEKSENCHGKDL